MTKANQQITVKGIEISFFQQSNNDYISLTGIARYKNPIEPKDIVKNWLNGGTFAHKEKVEISIPTKVGKLPTIIYLWFMQVSRRRAASKKAWKYN